jgi:hypothetical protein
MLIGLNSGVEPIDNRSNADMELPFVDGEMDSLESLSVFWRRCHDVAEHACADSQKNLQQKCIPAADQFEANMHNHWSNPDLWSGGLRAHEITSPPFRDSERDSKPNWATRVDQFVPLPKENRSQRLHVQPHFGSDLISETLKETPTGLA